MTKEQVVQGYLMNSPKVVAEMLYETIERYESMCCDTCKSGNVCNIYKIVGSNVGLLVSCNKWESK